MTGPGDEMTARRGHLRASHGDREQVIDRLKAAFVEGRLTRDEFDARVAQAFTSRTFAELAALTADLPAGPAMVRPPARPGRPRAAADRAFRSGMSLIAVGVTMAAAAWAVAGLTGSTALFVLAVTMTIAACGALLLGGTVMLESRHERGSAGQLPRNPRGGGRTSRRQASSVRPPRSANRGRPAVQTARRPRSPSPSAALHLRPGGRCHAPGY